MALATKASCPHCRTVDQAFSFIGGHVHTTKEQRLETAYFYCNG